MNLKEYALGKVGRTSMGARLIEDKRYRVLTKAVFSLIVNLLYAFYNGILGMMSSSLIFVASSVYYLLLSVMRFSVVLSERKFGNGRKNVSAVGVMLIILSVIFQVMVFASMRDETASVYGTIPMITIATFTFAKITAAAVTAVKYRKNPLPLYKAVNVIRYSEVAVSLLTMQQSMLVSFGEGTDSSAVILNACTGAGVCLFIMGLGIFTIYQNGKEETDGKVKNRQGK